MEAFWLSDGYWIIADIDFIKQSRQKAAQLGRPHQRQCALPALSPVSFPGRIDAVEQFGHEADRLLGLPRNLGHRFSLILLKDYDGA